MHFPINSSFPITVPKLNFYLAQSKKPKPSKPLGSSQSSPGLHPKILSQSYMKNPHEQIGKINLNPNQNKAQMFENEKKVSNPNLNHTKAFISDNSHSTLSYQNDPKPQLKHPCSYHDSLDGLFSSRSRQENRKKQFSLQNLFNNQYNLLNSPAKKQKYFPMQKNYETGSFVNRDMNRGRENLEFFRHHKIDAQHQTQKQSETTMRKRMIEKEQLGQGIRDISNELERINYELHVNSSKLHNMINKYEHLAKYPSSRQLKRNSLNYPIIRAENRERRISRIEEEPEFYQYQNLGWQPIM